VIPTNFIVILLIIIVSMLLNGITKTPSINCCNTGINYMLIAWWANIFLDLTRLERLNVPAKLLAY